MVIVEKRIPRRNRWDESCPAVGQCECGRRVVLQDPLTNDCACGRAYNVAGNQVKNSATQERERVGGSVEY